MNEKMTKDEEEKVLHFVDRGSWIWSLRMKRDDLGYIDLRDQGNIALIRDEIAKARSEAYILTLDSGEVEKIMDESNTKADRPAKAGEGMDL